MDFDSILNILNRNKYRKLPASAAHNLVMDMTVRQQIFKRINHRTLPKQAAVLALIYPNAQQQAQMVFILRKTYKGHHSGQISFPGGKREVFDADLKATALRETQEEVGLPSKLITIKKQLSPIFIPISNFEVQPFLGICNQTPDFKLDPVEVESILEFPFAQILYNPLVSINHTYFGQSYTLKAFQVNQYKIWGATAMILSEIVQLFK